MSYLIHFTGIRRLTLGKVGFWYQPGGLTPVRFLWIGSSGVENMAGSNVVLTVTVYQTIPLFLSLSRNQALGVLLREFGPPTGKSLY